MENVKYKFGSFILDPAEQLLSNDGRIAEIDPQEFDILFLLVKSAGQLVTRERLIKEIWKDAFVEEGTVSAAVSRVRQALRKALKTKNDNKVYIKAVPKKGFRFVYPVEELRDLDKQASRVEKSVSVAESVTPPLFDSYEQIQELIRAVGFMGQRLQRLESFVSQQSISAGDNTRFDVIDILPEGEEKAKIFLGLAQKVRQELIGGEQNTWLDRLDRHLDNVRAALHHYANQGSAASAPQELEMVVSIARFWDIRGYWPEGRAALEHALARQQPGDSDLKAKGLAWLGLLLWNQDEYSEAKRVLLEGVTMSRAVDDLEALAMSLQVLGSVAESEGRYRDAKFFNLESLKWSRKAKLGWLIGWSTRGLGMVAEAQADYPRAQKHFRTSLFEREKIQDLRGMAAVLNSLSMVARQQGDHFQSRLLADKSIMLSQGAGDRIETSYSLFNLGLVEEASGRCNAASGFFKKSLILRNEIGDGRGIAKAIEAIARMDFSAGNEKQSARKFGAADALRISIAAPLSPAELKSYGHLRDSLKKKFLVQWEDGRQRSVDEMIT